MSKAWGEIAQPGAQGVPSWPALEFTAPFRADPASHGSALEVFGLFSALDHIKEVNLYGCSSAQLPVSSGEKFL